jgi:erythronate-4-phosphate dehydrogenase
MARTSDNVGMPQLLAYYSSTVLAVADRNIPQLEEALAGVCELRVLPGSEITRENVRDADLLFTRSTVKVGPALLQGTAVRFVATATIGTDHMDVRWLESQGITWAAAPGSNADSVVQWFAAALLTLHERRQLDLANLRIGIVGVGNVGSRVERLCRALAIPILRCDPPRKAREGGDFVTLDEILRECNLVTLHVPLDDVTRHFLDPARVREWLINACRGEVVDTRKLLAASRKLVLDVFENEPTPSKELVAAAALATPHIAGHSLNGKLNGTRMVYEAACHFLGRDADWQPTLPPREPLSLRVEGKSDESLLLEAIRTGYRIEDDDRVLRELAGESFRTYRDQYPARYELTGTRVSLSEDRARLSAALSALGASPNPTR